MMTETERKRLAGFKQAALDAYEGQVAENLPFASLMKTGADAIDRLGFPHRMHEAFTYLDTTALGGITFVPKKGEKNGAVPERLLDSAHSITSKVVAIAGGDLDSNVAGYLMADTPLVVASLAGALDDGLRHRLEASVASEEDVFSALNAAFIQGGAYIEVPAGVDLVKPVVVICHTPQGAVDASRVVITVGAGAAASVIVWHSGGGDATVTFDVSVANDARLSLYHHDCATPTARRLIKYGTDLGSNAKGEFGGYVGGGGLSRIHTDWRLTGDRSDVHYSHLAILDEKQQGHHYARFHHVGKETKSDILWRNIVAGSSRVSVDSTVVVEATGTGTDSNQQIKSLNLQEGATVDAKPNLMIFTDEVKAAHGATVGQVDEEQLYYFRARGIDAATARTVLTKSFAEVVVGRLTTKDAAYGFERALSKKLKGITL